MNSSKIPDASSKLEELIQQPFNVDDAMRLVRLGANPNVKRNNTDSLLHLFVINNEDGKYNEKIEELVSKYKTDINILNAKGLSPLGNLIYKPFSVDDAMRLVRLGANPNVKRKNGDSLLHIFLRNNCYGIFEELVSKYKADINITNAEGLSPLGSLIQQPFHIDDAMTLVRLGANPNVKRNNTDSLLHLIIKNNQDGDWNELIKELIIKYKADFKGINLSKVEVLKIPNNDKKDNFSIQPSKNRPSFKAYFETDPEVESPKFPIGRTMPINNSPPELPPRRKKS